MNLIRICIYVLYLSETDVMLIVNVKNTRNLWNNQRDTINNLSQIASMWENVFKKKIKQTRIRKF